MEHRAVKTDLPSHGLPFSWGVRHGNLLFVAGQGPIGEDGKVKEGDIAVQTRVTLENFQKVVEAAGSRLECVVSTTVYLKDLGDFDVMNRVYREYFKKEPRPARATVRADLLFGMRIEVQGIAYVPKRKNRQPHRPRSDERRTMESRHSRS